MGASFTRQGFPELPRYDQNRLGANVGFPIVEDSVFFFGSFEYIPLGFANVPVSPIFSPTSEGFAAIAAMQHASPVNLEVLRNALGTAPSGSSVVNINGEQIPVGPAAFAARSYQNQYNGVGALDFRFGQSDNVRARYVHNAVHANNNGVVFPSFYAPRSTRSLLGSLSEYHNFAGGSINELRLGYNRFDLQTHQNPTTFAGLGVSGFPSISIQELNLQLGPNLYSPQQAALSTFSLADNYHWTMGRQTLRTGYDGRRFVGPVSFPQLAAGSYMYSTLEGFVANLPPDISGLRTTGDLSYATNQWDSYLYVKDDIRMRPNFELDLGLRFEFASLPPYLRAQKQNSIADVPGVLTFRTPEMQKTGFAPQIGLAYSPGTSHSSVFRAGFGMNYDATAYTTLAPLFAPGLATTLYTNGLRNVPGFFSPGGFFEPTFGSNLSPQARTTSFIPNQKLPYSMQWSASYQQAVYRKFVLELRYLGVRGVHLPAAGILNQTSPVTATNNLPLFFNTPSQATLNGLTTNIAGLQAQAANNPFAAAGFVNPIFQMTTSGNSFYNGLAVQGTQRLAGGLQVIAAYTWSHLIDDISSPLLSPIPSLGLLEQRTIRDSSLYDHRHRGTLTWSFDVGSIGPNGFRWYRDIVANLNFAGTYIYESPAPLPVLSAFAAGFATPLGAPGVVVNPNGTRGVGSGVTPLTNSLGQLVAYQANNPNAQFISGAPGLFTNSGRIRMPGLRPINTFDLSMVKRFGIRDKFAFEIRGDAYNVFNHPQFTPGELDNIGLPPQTQSLSYLIAGASTFGNVENSLSSHPRMLQVAVRVVF